MTDQREQWERTFATRRDFLGADPSQVARDALDRFAAAGVGDLLELGAGQGRDTRLFLGAGLRVTAADYADPGLQQIRADAAAAGREQWLVTSILDVRGPLPLGDATFDAVFAHMLFCMSLTTPEIESLMGEVRRVLRPGGLLTYTVRNTSDAHFGAGIDHGDDRWEMGGFVVHFFDRAFVERLAAGWEELDLAEYEEGRLPRRLYGVTMRKPGRREGGDERSEDDR
jgi:SAM-dependent methyltransferase